MAEEGKVVHEFEPHAESYGVFVKLVVATVLSTLFILVGLLAIGFAKTASVLVGTGTIVVGLGAVTLSVMTGGRNWLPATALLILSFLLTATLL